MAAAESLGDELDAFAGYEKWSGYEMCGGFSGSARSATIKRTVRRKKKNEGALSDGTFEAAMGPAGDELEVPPTPPPRVRRETKIWEFPRANITLGTVLGEGNFGKVYSALCRGLIAGEPETRVAIKTLSAAGPDAEEEFAAEMRVMKAVSACDAIVRLLGVTTDKSPHYMIMEFMGEGDLKEMLKKHRPRASAPSKLGANRLAQMGADVAEGMAHIGSLSIGIVHRDLAARNCMVAADLKVKVGDFGLTRKTYSKEYYRMKNAAPLPIRWMAFESLEDGIFNVQTDLWSFGVVLWEILTYGKLPYPDLDNVEVYDALADDYRLPAPPFCPDGFYELMLQCWDSAPAERGTFEQKRAALAALAARLPSDPVTRAMFKGRAAAPAPAGGGDGDGGGDDDDGGGGEPTYRPVYTEPAAGAGTVDGGDPELDVVHAAYDTPSGGFEGRARRPTVRRPKTEISGGGGDPAAVAEWVAATTGEPVDPTALHAALKSGALLCKLAAALKPGSVNAGSGGGAGGAGGGSTFKQRQAISRALEAFSAEFGLPEATLFDVADLHDDLDMIRVVKCLAALKAKVDG